MFTITPAEGYVYTDGDGKRYDDDYTLYTTIIPDGNEALMALLDEHGVAYTRPYQPPTSLFAQIMAAYILPTALTFGAMLLLFRVIARRGGIGG